MHAHFVYQLLINILNDPGKQFGKVRSSAHRATPRVKLIIPHQEIVTAVRLDQNESIKNEIISHRPGENHDKHTDCHEKVFADDDFALPIFPNIIYHEKYR